MSITLPTTLPLDALPILQRAHGILKLLVAERFAVQGFRLERVRGATTRRQALQDRALCAFAANALALSARCTSSTSREVKAASPRKGSIVDDEFQTDEFLPRHFLFVRIKNILRNDRGVHFVGVDKRTACGHRERRHAGLQSRIGLVVSVAQHKLLTTRVSGRLAAKD
ncbi:hypothetical protein FA951_03455 [Dermacoccus nishinomiyaensis]|nr:hypothetical protein FA951_03455 [Dermacoccus nishinomiyaensis]